MLSAQHLVKAFAGRRIIEDVTLQLERGEVVGLLGPNGAGKTTTFNMLTGMVTPDAGAIALDDHDITAMPFYDRARFGIAYLPQAPFVPRGLTVEQNILLVLEARLSDTAARKARLEELIGEFRLEEQRRKRVGELSGGQRRRCEIATQGFAALRKKRRHHSWLLPFALVCQNTQIFFCPSSATHSWDISSPDSLLVRRKLACHCA